MSFWFGDNLEHLLLPSINVTTVTGIIVACICTVGLVLIFEASKIGLAYSKFYSAILRPNERQDCFTDDMLLVENRVSSSHKRYTWFLIEVGFYVVEIILGYIIMLLVMTYNGYLMITVLMASGVGYFLGGQILMAIEVKTSKLKLPCHNCPAHPKNSVTSSTEGMSESVNEGELEGSCCLQENDPAETELKY